MDSQQSTRKSQMTILKPQEARGNQVDANKLNNQSNWTSESKVILFQLKGKLQTANNQQETIVQQI